MTDLVLSESWRSFYGAFPAPEKRDSLENPSTDIAKALTGYLDGPASAAGPRVGLQSSLRQSVVVACIRVLSETIASLPWPVYKRTKAGKEIAREHPLYSVLHDSPNDNSTSFDFRETMVAQSCIWGRSHSIINRRPSSGTVSLIQTLPTLVRREFGPKGRLQYKLTFPGGVVETFPAEEMIDIRGLCLDGVTSIAPVLYVLREAIGQALAIEEHNSRFFSNGARPGGVLSADGALGDVARERIKIAWAQMQEGLANAYRTAILEGGLKYTPITMQSDHAQLQDSRRFQVEEICRPFRMPPVFVQDHTRSTFSNSEQQDVHFAKHTISPWCVRIEQEVNRKLFAGTDFFCEFKLDGLVRGDFKARTEGYAKALGGPGAQGYMTVNEVRERENLPPIEGGDRLLMATPPAPKPADDSGGGADPDEDDGNKDAEQ